MTKDGVDTSRDRSDPDVRTVKRPTKRVKKLLAPVRSYTGRKCVICLTISICFAQTSDPYCNADYLCKYSTPGGLLYDIKRLCKGSSPYTYTNVNGATFSFQLCGTSSDRCQPQGYRVEYNFAPAMQFFGSDPLPTENCTDNFLNQVPCTRDCEVLGAGPPILGLLDQSNPFAGVNLTYYSVPNSPSDPFPCLAINPRTKEPYERRFVARLECDFSQVTPVVELVAEIPPGSCNYVAFMRASDACPCAPQCGGRNCGPNGCGGFCGPTGYSGKCNDNETCIDGACCQPACHNRNCGDDGCGSLNGCGSCGPNAVCTKYGQCGALPSPGSSPSSPGVTTTVSLTSAADLFASFLGGVFTVALGTLGAMFIARWRSGAIHRAGSKTKRAWRQQLPVVQTHK